MIVPAYVSTRLTWYAWPEPKCVTEFCNPTKSLQVNQHHTNHSDISHQKQNLLLGKMHKFTTHVLLRAYTLVQFTYILPCQSFCRKYPVRVITCIIRKASIKNTNIAYFSFQTVTDDGSSNVCLFFDADSTLLLKILVQVIIIDRNKDKRLINKHMLYP